MGRDLTARAITGSGDNSRDLTRRTEGRTVGKVIGGVGKKSGKGGVGGPWFQLTDALQESSSHLVTSIRSHLTIQDLYKIIK